VVTAEQKQAFQWEAKYRWQNFRSRQKMNLLHQRRKIVGGSKFGKFGPLGMHFLHSGARIRVFEQNRKHKSPLKLFRIQARFYSIS